MMASKIHYYKILPTRPLCNTFRAAKFDEDLNATDTLYEVSLTDAQWPPCNCPSRKQPCKHRKWAIRLNKAFIKGTITIDEMLLLWFDPQQDAFVTFVDGIPVPVQGI